MGINLAGADLHYGTHSIRFATLPSLTLKQAYENPLPDPAKRATNPAHVNLEIFNGAGTKNWELWVHSEPYLGEDRFAKMLVLNGKSIFGSSAKQLIFAKGNDNQILHTFNTFWLDIY